MKTQNTTLANSINFLQHIISNGGPEEVEYETLNKAFDTISTEFKSGCISEAHMRVLQDSFNDGHFQNTFLGHVRAKPFGYAGDFLIIDKIYREQVTADQRFQKWDKFWNNLSASKAVRNRKDYFIKTMRNRVEAGVTKKMLNVASGPARDVAELYKLIDPHALPITCVEADNYAINYAKNLNKANAEHINFIHKNIFRFQTEEKFDIIWSAGLFDYFDDVVFAKLVSKFISWCKPGGEIIIGNFGLENPSRNYMELVGDWYLEHRSEDTLINLALQAGAKRENIYVGSEVEGVNLFLHIKVQ